MTTFPRGVKHKVLMAVELQGGPWEAVSHLHCRSPGDAPKLDQHPRSLLKMEHMDCGCWEAKFKSLNEAI